MVSFHDRSWGVDYHYFIGHSYIRSFSIVGDISKNSFKIISYEFKTPYPNKLWSGLENIDWIDTMHSRNFAIVAIQSAC